MMHPPPSLAAVLALEDCSNGHQSPASTCLASSPTLLDPELTTSPPQGTHHTALVSPITYHQLAPAIMREEVNAAVEFFLKMVVTPQLSLAMPRLGRNLSKVLSNKYKDHWFLNAPHRGQAYRCIQICDSQGADRVLAEAAAASGLRYSELRLPADLCVWVDPKEVACRFGDELGSFLPIYINENGKKRSFVDKFDFERLCERAAPMGPLIVGRGGRIVDRGVLRRVGSGGVERVEVEVEQGVSMAPSPSSSVSLLICGGADTALLTPPSTPPHSPDHSSSSPRSPSTSPVLFTLPPASPTKRSPPSNHHSLHHLNNNVINSGYQRNKHYQQHGNMNQYNSNNLHSRSPPQHHHHQHHSHHQQQMSVSPTHHYHQHHNNINNNNNNSNSHYHSSTTSTNYNIYNNSNCSNLNSNAAYYGSTNGNGFSRSPPRFNDFSGSKPAGKWGPQHGTVFPSSVASNNNLHHHLHHQQQEQQQQYCLQQKREVDSPRWLWRGRRSKV